MLRVAIAALLLPPSVLDGLVNVMQTAVGAVTVTTIDENIPDSADESVEESGHWSAILAYRSQLAREREEKTARLLAEKRDWRLKKKTWRTENIGWKTYMRLRIRNGALGDAFKDLKCACCGCGGFTVRYKARNHALEKHPRKMQRWMDRVDKEINEVHRVCLILEGLSWDEIQVLKGDLICQDVFYDATSGLDPVIRIRYGPRREF